MGKKRPTQNILAKKLPEIQDIPKIMKLSIYGSGSLIGEEDTLNRDFYNCTLKCETLKGTLYVIKKQDFMMIRH